MIYWEKIISILLPQFYPNELLYSVLARYRERLQLTDAEIQISVFGKAGVLALLDLPTKISLIHERLPPWMSMREDSIINSHTLYSYYSAFLELDQRERLSKIMKGNGRGVQSIAGINKGDFSRKLVCSYCIECITEDRKTFGEAYWHTIHQTSASWFCYKHPNMPLTQSSLEKTTRSSLRTKYISLEYYLRTAPKVDNTHLGEYNFLLQQLSQRAHWLFMHRPTIPDGNWIRAKNMSIIFNFGFADRFHSVDYEGLTTFLQHRLPYDLIKKLGYSGDEKRNFNWLFSLFNSSARKMTLQSLLFTIVFSTELDDYFNLESNAIYSSKFRVASKRKFKCLNNLCSRFGDLTCKMISVCGKPKRFRVECELCEYIYETHSINNYSFFKMIDPGRIWKEKLLEISNQPSFSLEYAAKTLDTSLRTIETHMNLMNISKIDVRLRRGNPNYHIDINANRNIKIRKYRSAIIDYTKDHPEFNFKEVKLVFKREYRFLLENDRTWLYANFSHLKKYKANTWQESIVSGESSDSIMSACINSMKDTTIRGIPCIRITESRLIKLFRQKAEESDYIEHWQIKNYLKRPNILQGQIESVEEFHIRKVNAFFGKMQDECKIVPASKFYLETGIKKKSANFKIIALIELYVLTLIRELGPK